MKKSQWFEPILEANKKLYTAASSPLKSHGPDHHIRVYQNALMLSKYYPCDQDVLVAACLLHDLAAYYPDKVGDKYHDFDDVYANKVLLKVGFPKEKTEKVRTAVKLHGSDSKYREKAEPIEVTLLRDADKLETVGAIGIARIIMVRTLKGDTLDEIIEDFLNRGHYVRKWKSIKTPEAKKLGKAGFQYGLQFLKDLKRTLVRNNRKNPNTNL